MNTAHSRFIKYFMKRYTALFACGLLCAAMLSCGASASMAIRKNRSADVSLSLSVPQAMEIKLRQFTGGKTSAPLFDAAAIEASLTRRGLRVKRSASPTQASYKADFSIDNIETLIANDSDVRRIVHFEQSEGWAALRFFISRDSALSFVQLFPGIPEDLLESLQPPAFYDNPVTKAEYRTMLESLLGSNAAAALDALYLELSLAVPASGTIQASAGAFVDQSKKTVSYKLPVLDMLVLENPMGVYVKWQE